MKFRLTKQFLSALVVVCVVGPSLEISITGLDLLNSAGSIISGITTELLQNLPSPSLLFSATKQVLFGLPELAVFKVINELCSIYMGSDELEPRIVPNIGEMAIQLKSPCSSISLPINQTENLLLIPEFDISKKVVIYVSGWLSNVDDDKIEELARAYNCRGDYNFMALNASNFIQTLYTWSAFNTEEVGAILGQGIVKIASKIPIGNIHLIGHSLGAHIVGKAGREFTAQTNQTLPRITGLDPANPCFNQGEALSGLYRGDAAFVDVIHSNPGVLGKAHPIGDADFYPEGLGSIKPGCIMFGCSHSRAVDYYLETIFPGNEMNFLAKRCNSLQGYNAGQCNGPEYPMGIATPSNLKGDYFLSVNRESPFGKNASDIVSINHTTCGFCNI